MNAKRYMSGRSVIEVQNKACAPSKKCEQVFKVVQQKGKFGVVLNYLRAEFGKFEKDAQPRTIIFCHSSDYCEKLVLGLEVNKIPVLPLCGSRGQDLREESLKKFRDGDVKILVVSDVGSRGLDVKDVDFVVQFYMAYRYDIYVNRVGRTGRIRHGKCVSFVDLEKDSQVLHQIKKAMEEAGQDIPQSLYDAVGDFDPNAGFGFKNFNGNVFGAAPAASIPSDSAIVGKAEPSFSSEVFENFGDTKKKEEELQIASASVANETVKPTTSFASSAPPVEAETDVEEKAGLPPTKESNKIFGTEDVRLKNPEVPAQVVQHDFVFEDLIEKMKIAMKEADAADEIIEVTVAIVRAKHDVAAVDASTQKAPEHVAAADAPPNVPGPRDEENVPGMHPVFSPPVFRPPVFDADDGWD